MANYINKYANNAEYLTDETKQYPNTSYVVATDRVMFAETAFGGLTVKYNIVDPSVEVTLFNGGGGGSSSSGSSSSESGSGSGGGGVMPTKMYIDGVEETPINTWRFETTGEHIVQYEFADNILPAGFLNGGIQTATEAIIGDDITEIDYYAFSDCVNIASVTLPNSVTSIGVAAFGNCTSLASVTIEATTPPTLGSDAFGNNASGRKIYVPAASLTVYQTAWSAYSSDIEAIS